MCIFIRHCCSHHKIYEIFYGLWVIIGIIYNLAATRYQYTPGEKSYLFDCPLCCSWINMLRHCMLFQTHTQFCYWLWHYYCYTYALWNCMLLSIFIFHWFFRLCFLFISFLLYLRLDLCWKQYARTLLYRCLFSDGMFLLFCVWMCLYTFMEKIAFLMLLPGSFVLFVLFSFFFFLIKWWLQWHENTLAWFLELGICHTCLLTTKKSIWILNIQHRQKNYRFTEDSFGQIMLLL